MSKIIHTTEETKELGIPSDNTQEPMQEDTIPTTISVAIIGFYDINTALSQFSVRMRLILNFPSLVPLKELNSFKTGGNRVYYHPDTVRQSLPTQSTQFHNSITTEWQENEFYNEKQGHLVFHTSDDGSSEDSLCLERVLNGTFKHPFELQMFPFDKQNLPISIRFWNSSIHDFKRAYEVKQLPRSMHISEQMARFPDWTRQPPTFSRCPPCHRFGFHPWCCNTFEVVGTFKRTNRYRGCHFGRGIPTTAIREIAPRLSDNSCDSSVGSLRQCLPT